MAECACAVMGNLVIDLVDHKTVFSFNLNDNKGTGGILFGLMATMPSTGTDVDVRNLN